MHPLLVSEGHKPRTGVVEKCNYCGIEVYSRPSRKKLYKQRFCSKEHLWAFQQKDKTFLICEICGNKKYTQPFAIKFKNAKTCSRKCYTALVRKRTLERHSKLPPPVANRLARRMPELVQWRKAVFSRDDYTCWICERRGGYLEADHMLPFAYFPEYRHITENGRTLCRECHDETKISWWEMRSLYTPDYITEIKALFDEWRHSLSEKQKASQFIGNYSWSKHSETRP